VKFPWRDRELWYQGQIKLLQGKLDRLEAAVWAQQSPAGAAYAQTLTKPTQLEPGATVSTWEQFEKDFYEKQAEETANDSSVRTEKA